VCFDGTELLLQNSNAFRVCRSDDLFPEFSIPENHYEEHGNLRPVIMCSYIKCMRLMGNRKVVHPSASMSLRPYASPQ
jgi:hypothetical protein